MAIRSRHGCVDCKRAKVKCDEVHPSCGTCSRRGRQCSGYNVVSKRRGSKTATQASTTLDRYEEGDSTPRKSKSMIEGETCSFPACSNGGVAPTVSLSSLTEVQSPPLERSRPRLPPPIGKSLVPIPPGSVNASDEPLIEVYFLRHPSESVFGPEFIDEMNASVLKVFQNNPVAVGDTLSAIGEAYLKDTTLDSLVLIPNRRARILQRLRNLDTKGVSLELLLTTMLGLCAVELINSNEKPQKPTAVPVLLENLSMMLDHRLRRGCDLSQLAKYFLRALARQDMMISLAKFHRPKIPTSYWLDDTSRRNADRFMGYTCSLMPIMSDLCALAEDIHAGVPSSDSTNGIDTRHSFDHSAMYLERAIQIKSNLELWRPALDTTISFNISRKFILHANAYRSACLLYLHRLLNPAGASVEADQSALIMAYEIMTHTSGSEDDMKMALWPVFLASCEVSSTEDRLTATHMLEVICQARKTATSFQILSFVANRVWDARDNGRDWSWMTLSQKYPDEMLPI